MKQSPEVAGGQGFSLESDALVGEAGARDIHRKGRQTERERGDRERDG